MFMRGLIWRGLKSSMWNSSIIVICLSVHFLNSECRGLGALWVILVRSIYKENNLGFGRGKELKCLAEWKWTFLAHPSKEAEESIPHTTVLQFPSSLTVERAEGHSLAVRGSPNGQCQADSGMPPQGHEWTWEVDVITCQHKIKKTLGIWITI